MMKIRKILFCTILLFAFIFPVVGQTPNDSVVVNKEQPTFSNQLDIDVQLIGLELNYKRKISNKFSLGIGVGIGLTAILAAQKNIKKVQHIDYATGVLVTDENKFNPSNQLERYGFKIFVDYQLSNKIHFSIASKVASFVDDTEHDWFYGLELGIFYIVKRVEFGIKPIYGILKGYSSPSKVTGLPVFLIRIPLNKW